LEALVVAPKFVLGNEVAGVFIGAGEKDPESGTLDFVGEKDPESGTLDFVGDRYEGE
jgi:hypothetical protein